MTPKVSSSPSMTSSSSISIPSFYHRTNIKLLFRFFVICWICIILSSTAINHDDDQQQQQQQRQRVSPSWIVHGFSSRLTYSMRPAMMVRTTTTATAFGHKPSRTKLYFSSSSSSCSSSSNRRSIFNRDSVVCFETPPSSSSTEEDSTQQQQEQESSKLDAFLAKKYPMFYKTLMNDEMKKIISASQSSISADDGTDDSSSSTTSTTRCTVFVPNAAAFETLGTKKLQQLDDPRNAEIRDKMGSYHIIPTEAVSAVELLTEDWTKVQPGQKKANTVVASIVTMSGEVPVGRSSSSSGSNTSEDPDGGGGFLSGLIDVFKPKTEDGDIVIGPNAKIVQSFVVDGNYVHEVDSLISPVLLWRYCDQLRIL